jgi:hypothetical protein
VDKCDGNCAVMLVNKRKKIARVANLFFINFVHFGKKMHVQIKKIAHFFAEITFHRRFFAPFAEFCAFQPQIRSFRRHIF